VMVDMSPEAVGERLRLMGELWELSVKLMDAKKVDEESDDNAAVKIVETAEDGSQNRERQRPGI
jgi:hypothetical protein